MEKGQQTNAAFQSEQPPGYFNQNQRPPPMGAYYPHNNINAPQAYAPPSNHVGVVMPTSQFIPLPVEMRHAKCLIGLGITQMVLGGLMIILEIIIQTTYNYYVNYYYTGIWCGVFFILAGLFGVLGGKRNNMGCVIACMVLCIIIAVLVVFSGIGTYAIQIQFNYYIYDYRRYNSTIVAVCIVGLIILVVEEIIAITQSAFTCATCCGRRTNVVNYPIYQQPQTVYVTTQQPAAPYPQQQTGGYQSAQY